MTGVQTCALPISLLQFTDILSPYLQWLDFMSAPFQDFMSRKSWDDDPLLSLPPLGHSDQIPEVRRIRDFES